ncbi:MAG: hypothetical protein J1F35_06140 [Erysipelotrichales bacterium]|nr:hypothetical protein [Erysipelotrichales bacterium]
MKTFASSVVQGGLNLNPVTADSSLKDLIVNQINNNVIAQVGSMTSGQDLDVAGINFTQTKPDYRYLLEKFDFTKDTPQQPELVHKSIIPSSYNIVAKDSFDASQRSTIENDFKWSQGIFNQMNLYRGAFKRTIGVLADAFEAKDEKGNDIEIKNSEGKVIGVEYDSHAVLPKKGKYQPSLFNPMYGVIGGSITDNIPILDDADLDYFNSTSINTKAAKYLSDCSIETLVKESKGKGSIVGFDKEKFLKESEYQQGMFGLYQTGGIVMADADDANARQIVEDRAKKMAEEEVKARRAEINKELENLKKERSKIEGTIKEEQRKLDKAKREAKAKASAADREKAKAEADAKKNEDKQKAANKDNATTTKDKDNKNDGTKKSKENPQTTEKTPNTTATTTTESTPVEEPQETEAHKKAKADLEAKNAEIKDKEEELHEYDLNQTKMQKLYEEELKDAEIDSGSGEGEDDAIPLLVYADPGTNEVETIEYYPSVLGAAKYKYADFMYCKDLGKVSNNHLITLRKFDMPIGDDINFNIGAQSRKIHDVGRLITWFGTEDNKLETIMSYDYEATWKEFTAEHEEQQSQEEDSSRGMVGTLANLTSAAYNKQQLMGIALNPISKMMLGSFGAEPTYAGNPVMTGQRYDKNKIYDPVNTVRSTHKYEGILKFNHEFSLKFCYKLRSYDNINPKSAFLDLLANILVVTYRKGSFWGGSRSVYGPKTNRSTWNKANSFLDGIQNRILDVWSGFIGGGFNFGNLISGLGKLAGDVWEKAKNFFTSGDWKVMLGKVSTGILCGLIGGLRNKLGRPAVYAFSSMLDGGNVGLWHVTIGNPKNPIASFGNMILTKAKITHSGPLGIDDFPTELIVEVSLKHARPRDMEEIQKMYTRGKRAIYYSYSTLKSNKQNGGPSKKQTTKLKRAHSIKTSKNYHVKPKKKLHAKRARDERH